MKTIAFTNEKVVFDKDNSYAKLSYYVDGRLVTDYCVPVDSEYFPVFKTFGNCLFLKFKNNPSLISSFEYFSLDYAILLEDFDCYSDFYKDLYCMRPHLTKEQWEDLISRTKKEYKIGS